MIRWKFTFDKDNEQDWLNDYARQGWAMTSFFAGVVTFTPCQPGEYVYQIDLLPGKGLMADNYEDYVAFMREMNVEVLQRWGRWVYLRKRTEEGAFEVYTDTASKLAQYKRIRGMFLWALAIICLCSVSAWNLLVRYPGSIAVRGLAGLYIVMIAAIVRAVWVCSSKIKELDGQDG